MAGTKGTAEIATRYPVVKGNVARTTKIEGRAINQIPLEGSIVSRREKEGL